MDVRVLQRLLDSSVRKSAALCAAESQLVGALSSKEAAAVDAVVLRTLREELERLLKETDAEREARAKAEEKVAAAGREAAKAKEMEEAARKAECAAKAASDEAEAVVRRERERADKFEVELKQFQGSSSRKFSSLHVVSCFCSCLPCF